MSAKDRHQKITAEELKLLCQGLEIGMCDNRLLGSLFEQLDASPDELLPRAMPLLNETAFFLWKSDRTGFAKRLLFTCLAWYLQQTAEDGRAIAESLQHILAKEGTQLTIEEVEQQARAGRFGHATSFRLDVSGLDASRVTELSSDGTLSKERIRFAAGLTPTITARMPLQTFRGWLKRFDPQVLNGIGRTVLRNVFPLFGETSPEHHVSRMRSLANSGVRFSPEDVAEVSSIERLLGGGVSLERRRHRRYAGGDGLLPRNCYSSVSKDAAGNDSGTLSRELLAYADHRLPGTVFVGDSTDERLCDLLGNFVKVLPGYCAVFVLLFEPQDADEQAAFKKVYREVLDITGTAQSRPVHVFAFEARVDECIVDNVIDLRWPHVQQWFFDQFRDGDGAFLTKKGGTAREFYDMLPTLMHPSLGGNNVTHAIGSWMRSSAVNGLVFPSARSNTSVSMYAGAELEDWNGWNFLDYRTATNLPATEITSSDDGWPDFLQRAAQLMVATSDEQWGSWRVVGIQDGYDALKRQVDAGLST